MAGRVGEVAEQPSTGWLSLLRRQAPSPAYAAVRSKGHRVRPARLRRGEPAGVRCGLRLTSEGLPHRRRTFGVDTGVWVVPPEFDEPPARRGNRRVRRRPFDDTVSGRHLLDTHAFLWLSTQPERVPRATRDALAEADVVRAPESGCQRRGEPWPSGPLPSPSGTRSVWPGCQRCMAIPFDRALVAVAMAEGLTLVSRDRRLADYDVDTVW